MPKPSLVFLEREQLLVCSTCAESYGVPTAVMRSPERYVGYSETIRKKHLCRKHRKPAKPVPVPVVDPWKAAWAAFAKENSRA